MNANKNPNIKGRKFNGSPYLKLKKVKTLKRRTKKQRLRSAIEFAVSQIEKESLV